MKSATLASLLVLLFACGGSDDGPLVFDSPPPRGAGLQLKVGELDRIFVENEPQMVAGGSEQFVYRDSLALDFPEGRTAREVFIFHGVDLGDQVEMDTEIYIDGSPAYLRSGHGPDDDDDGWDSKQINLSGHVFRISILCRVTGVNPNLNRLAARPHWGIWVTFE